MTDRDHFAAAALAGLLASNPYDRAVTYAECADASYRMADAMLRERERVTDPLPKEKRAEVSAAPVSRPPETRTSGVAHSQAWSCDLHRYVTANEEQRMANHDAAPAATACTDADRDRSDKAAARPGEGTGDTREPVAWYGYAVRADGGFCKSLDFSQKDVERELAQNARTVIEIVPLYRQPQPTLTDEEREAVQWAATFVDDNYAVGAGDALRALLNRLT